MKNKNRLPRKEKKRIIKEGGIRHYRVMQSKIHGSVSTEHIPVDYGNFNWSMPIDLYLEKFREDKITGK